jgi:hypothetical protein
MERCRKTETCVKIVTMTNPIVVNLSRFATRGSCRRKKKSSSPPAHMIAVTQTKYNGSEVEASGQNGSTNASKRCDPGQKSEFGCEALLFMITLLFFFHVRHWTINFSSMRSKKRQHRYSIISLYHCQWHTTRSVKRADRGRTHSARAHPASTLKTAPCGTSADSSSSSIGSVGAKVIHEYQFTGRGPLPAP